MTQTEDTQEPVLAYTATKPPRKDCIALQDGPLLEHLTEENTDKVLIDWAPWSEDVINDSFHMNLDREVEVPEDIGKEVREDKVSHVLYRERALMSR